MTAAAQREAAVTRAGAGRVATGERLARLEQQMEHVVAKVDKISDRQDVIHAAMLQARARPGSGAGSCRASPA